MPFPMYPVPLLRWSRFAGQFGGPLGRTPMVGEPCHCQGRVRHEPLPICDIPLWRRLIFHIPSKWPAVTVSMLSLWAGDFPARSSLGVLSSNR